MVVIDALKRMDAILDIDQLKAPERTEHPKDNSVELKNVAYRYKDAAEDAVHGLNIKIGSGEHIALVGPSGGGKTTTAELIARLFDVTEGSILIGGADIRNIPQDELMDQVSFVFQDSKPLKASVLENVRLARPEASEQEVLKALDTAQCSDINFYTADENGRQVRYYTVTVKYKANHNEMMSSFTDTDSSLENLQPGDDIVIYFGMDDKYEVRPAYQMPSHVWEYLLFAAMTAGGIALFVFNLRTILRSRVPYAKKLVHENDVTEMYSDGKTDPFADNGLSDSSIDYAAQTDHSADGTETYADPFAVYTGYSSEQQTPADGQYFDPNAGYTPDIPQANIPSYSQEDLNNPFISQVNDDPDSPFNQGGYSSPAAQQQYSTLPEQPAASSRVVYCFFSRAVSSSRISR